MATVDDIGYIRQRCNRILIMLELRARATFSIDLNADAFADATFPMTAGLQGNIDGKITTALNELKARAAITTYP